MLTNTAATAATSATSSRLNAFMFSLSSGLVLHKARAKCEEAPRGRGPGLLLTSGVGTLLLFQSRCWGETVSPCLKISLANEAAARHGPPCREDMFVGRGPTEDQFRRLDEMVGSNTECDIVPMQCQDIVGGVRLVLLQHVSAAN